MAGFAGRTPSTSFNLLPLASLCLSFPGVAVTQDVQEKRNSLLLFHTEPSWNLPETALHPDRVYLVGLQGKNVDDKEPRMSDFEAAACWVS